MTPLGRKTPSDFQPDWGRNLIFPTESNQRSGIPNRSNTNKWQVPVTLVSWSSVWFYVATQWHTHTEKKMVHALKKSLPHLMTNFTKRNLSCRRTRRGWWWWDWLIGLSICSSSWVSSCLVECMRVTKRGDRCENWRRWTQFPHLHPSHWFDGSRVFHCIWADHMCTASLRTGLIKLGWLLI